MAILTLSTFPSLQRPNLSIPIPSSSSSPALPWRNVRLRSRGVASASTRRWIVTENPNRPSGLRKLRSAEEETLAPEQEEGGEAGYSPDQQAVSVPVSPSDTLTMFFQADGTMSEAAIPAVTQALETMAVSWAKVTYAPNRIPLCSAALSRCSTSFSNMCSARRGIFGFYLAGRESSMRALAMRRNKLPPFQPLQGTEEDLDEGSGSEDHEEDKEWEDNDLDYESDGEEEKDSVSSASVEKSHANKYKKDLVKEVELLLEPEEREILPRSEIPNLAKISTAKWAPLHTLALSGQVGSVDKLLEQGVDIDVADKDGLTALHTAIIGKKDAVICHLLRKGASPHVKDRDGATPLHYAVQGGVMQIVKILLKYNADLNVADNEGWTPLHVAVQSRSRDIVKVLLINGADKNRRNKDGKTPLDLSFCYGKNFNSYELATVLKVVPANRDF